MGQDASHLERVERVTIEVGKQTLKDVPGGVEDFDPFIGIIRSMIPVLILQLSCGQKSLSIIIWLSTSLLRSCTSAMPRKELIFHILSGRLIMRRKKLPGLKTKDYRLNRRRGICLL